MARIPDKCLRRPIGSGVVMVATFTGPIEAATAGSTLKATLEDLVGQVDELFRAQSGVVDADQIGQIYARVGLRNDVGWQQDRALFVDGAELTWELPEGALADDAENLLVSLGALNVVVHRPTGQGEAWRCAPVPFPLGGVPFEDNLEGDCTIDDDIYSTSGAPKRTLH